MSKYTSISEISAALKALIQEAFPGDTVHLERTPVDFKRPAFLVETGKIKPLPFSRSALLLQMSWKISAFVAVDEYYDSHFAELHDRLMTLVGLFSRQYVQVGDRAIKFSKPPEGETPGLDFAEVLLHLEWTEDRSAFPPIVETPPMIEQVDVRQE